jgi:hypothetical protein
MEKVEFGKKDLKKVEVIVTGKFLNSVPDAEKVRYDDSDTSLGAVNVQDAIDEIAGKVGQTDADISTIKADVAELERGLAEEAEARIEGVEQAKSYTDYRANDLGRRIDNTNSSVSAVAEGLNTYKSATDERLGSLEESADALERSLGNKQDTLVSGENIKTINGQPLLGSGNIQIKGGGYQPPVGGIPKADLSQEVQSSLDKADTALQEHQDLSKYAQLSQVQEIAADLVTKDAHTSDIQGLQSAIEEVASDMITAEPAEGDSEEVENYVVCSANVTNIVSISQADYDALETKDNTTLYLITE